VNGFRGNRGGTTDGGGVPLGSRLIDALLIVLLLPVLLPAGLLIGLAVFLDSAGPVIYRTQRVGLRGKPFVMLKFRTMRSLRGASLPSSGPSIAVALDHRVTPLGRFLRTTRLDELPQVWNVLRGEMRLVGPRPELVEFTEQYRDQYREILSAPPGVTGPTQIAFANDEARILSGQSNPGEFYSRHLLPRKIEIDLAYVRSHSVGSDLLMLGKTLLLPVKLGINRVVDLVRGPRRQVLARFLAAGTATTVLLLLLIIEAGSPR
jgi:lipopolysaccharide/colanic/teichoic acid biosynthesis glycosyltransferase